ncbi:hypothetical protein [Ruegeria sp.]|uniref:hypothetical protein n=1 Tax=Ruegeria sp. TaxID=1879320 RepID=UPI003B5B9556
MMRNFRNFITVEDGAVTVDWVVLTAGLVGFGAFVFVNLADPIQHVDTETGNALSAVTVSDLSFNVGNN